MTSCTESFLSGLTEKGKSMFSRLGAKFLDGATVEKNRHIRCRPPFVLRALPAPGE